MPSIRKTPSGNYELKVSSKLLPEIYYDTFSSREEAHAYGDRLATLLRQGIVPPALLKGIRAEIMDVCVTPLPLLTPG